VDLLDAAGACTERQFGFLGQVCVRVRQCFFHGLFVFYEEVQALVDVVFHRQLFRTETRMLLGDTEGSV
jgi:hypothetical protein